MYVCLSSAMHESSKNVQACLADMYEPEWYGKNEVDSIVEVRNLSYICSASVEMATSDWMLVDDDVCVKGLSSLTADKAPD